MKVNLGRLTHIDEVLEPYSFQNQLNCVTVSEELAENLIALLVDLKHWCDANKVDFDDRLRLAQMRYEVELSTAQDWLS